MSNQLILPRRGFLAGLGSLLLAPAVVKADSLMKVGNIDHILYPMRGLVDYNIMTDSLYVRVDRANFPLQIPKHIMHVLSEKEIKTLFTSEQLELIKPKSKSIRQQFNMSKIFNPQEWYDKGLLPSKSLVLERERLKYPC